ncbi:MAG: hypothetical protein EOP04_10895 [Proteobacteria bacterium]|nr:MAG: hypothetical protein EOP04_10895 [Pseudomonadota bacterium]
MSDQNRAYEKELRSETGCIRWHHNICIPRRFGTRNHLLACRNIVERAFGWIKEYRRIGTRYEKLGINFRGMVLLAMLKQYFLFMQSPDRT